MAEKTFIPLDRNVALGLLTLAGSRKMTDPIKGIEDPFAISECSATQLLGYNWRNKVAAAHLRYSGISPTDPDHNVTENTVIFSYQELENLSKGISLYKGQPTIR